MGNRITTPQTVLLTEGCILLCFNIKPFPSQIAFIQWANWRNKAASCQGAIFVIGLFVLFCWRILFSSDSTHLLPAVRNRVRMKVVGGEAVLSFCQSEWWNQCYNHHFRGFIFTCGSCFLWTSHLFLTSKHHFICEYLKFLFVLFIK